ncbi:hypothetical protein [Erythrobacter sp.]|uniref:hypothetical protein n=1 Tax=Erythrobacter sp. TaxID=1042 RepID=UPI0025EA5191|nr:hypothetical protein [Erythrobacter sp.]
MTQRNTPSPDGGRPAGLAPENHNSEQDQRGQQAQDVAADAQNGVNEQPGGTESRKRPSPGVDNVAGSETDLVEEMRRMEDTGRIDNSAYVGEPNHDDTPGKYDPGNDGDDDVVVGGKDGTRESGRPRR